MKPLMKCGHAANVTSNGKPACAICFCTEIAEKQPNLEGRKAKCCYCGKIANSNGEGSGYKELPFFEYKPNEEYDSYYCGCKGWD